MKFDIRKEHIKSNCVVTSIGIRMLFIIVFSIIFNGLCNLFLHKRPLTLLRMDLSFLQSADHQLWGDLLSLSFPEAMDTSQSSSWANRTSSFPFQDCKKKLFTPFLAFFPNQFKFFSQNDGSLTLFLKVFPWFESSLIRCFLLSLFKFNIVITSKLLTKNSLSFTWKS